jgi:hypothetical protein
VEFTGKEKENGERADQCQFCSRHVLQWILRGRNEDKKEGLAGSNQQVKCQENAHQVCVAVKLGGSKNGFIFRMVNSKAIMTS